MGKTTLFVHVVFTIVVLVIGSFPDEVNSQEDDESCDDHNAFDPSEYKVPESYIDAYAKTLSAALTRVKAKTITDNQKGIFVDNVLYTFYYKFRALPIRIYGISYCKLEEEDLCQTCVEDALDFLSGCDKNKIHLSGHSHRSTVKGTNVCGVSFYKESSPWPLSLPVAAIQGDVDINYVRVTKDDGFIYVEIKQGEDGAYVTIITHEDDGTFGKKE